MSKRILSIDGGGIRGVFAIGVLERIESLLKERYRDQKAGFVLADYFDFIGGTSTGAIIAAMLSKGMTVRAIRESYQQLCPIVFRRKPFWQSWRSFYGSEAFSALLKEEFEEQSGEPMTLGSAKLRTHLMVVLRNGTTGSTWPLINHPEARYNRRKLPDSESQSNLDIPLWKLIRASAAAPAYFPSELVSLYTSKGQETQFEFIDGSVSPYNNPAFAMFLAATLSQYGMNYSTGENDLFLCSVGTGSTRERYRPGDFNQINVVGSALRTLRSLLFSIAEEQDKICRVMGKCLHGEVIDRELGDLKEQGMNLFSYVRFQHEFTAEEKATCREKTRSRHPFEIDDILSLPELQRLGKDYAEKHVTDSLLPDVEM